MEDVTGAQIRAARALLGLSQGELAEQAGVSRATINSAENGLFDRKPTTNSKIARTLGPRVVFLMPGQDAPGGYGVRIKE
jgi:DNA-binding XRE family transcriptional regulator